MRRVVETAIDLATFGIGMTAILAVGIPLTVVGHAARMAVAAPLATSG